jgi:hypothetical protein
VKEWIDDSYQLVVDGLSKKEKEALAGSLPPIPIAIGKGTKKK